MIVAVIAFSIAMFLWAAFMYAIIEQHREHAERAKRWGID